MRYALIVGLLCLSSCKELFGPSSQTRLTVINATADWHLVIESVPAKGDVLTVELDPQQRALFEYETFSDSYEVCVTARATGSDSLGNAVSMGSTSREFNISRLRDRSFSWNIEQRDFDRIKDCGGIF